MHIYFSTDFSAQNKRQNIDDIKNQVSICNMRNTIQEIEGPRHYSFNPHHNHHVREWIATQLIDYGYNVYEQGQYKNVVALPRQLESTVTIVAAHYDSVPETPGADDNGSAVAAMLECARIVASQSLPICFIAFNCEEDGFLGSYDFVENLYDFPQKIDCVHVLEMLGYCSHEPKSQKIPTGISVRGIDTGNFIAIVGDKQAKGQLQKTLQNIATYTNELLAVGLQATMISTRLLHILKRSDHFPFWQTKIPALMWTDTAEYRNPHYHQPSDTIETLDFEFMRSVTTALVACLLESMV
ncbi:M20/M25/M40 family metallo-hydrolase [Candidatus Uabimicrobium amorphum]|uniref:Peptidase M28 n=1 Tax=Uabimicrobium amorphum TaxID=2596890 RepID=A0A5S9IS68_UABAM|nr:M20/M25/M40 family metallo-hydrolase [Candidatus Uabimicrobium amorphum]BBM86934.1 peptidase M28 [Candidatus Uabimicrobium amorphum]